MNKLGEAPVLATLPDNLRRDETVRNISRAIEKELGEVSRAAGFLLLLSRLSELSEAFIDELAWQYHVDAYDQTLPLEQKRAMVRQALESHRKKGTAAVVQNAVSIILQEGYVEEWFQYGGEPYHFRVILIRGPMAGEDTLKRLVETVNAVKNVRSWLDYVQFYREMTGALYIGNTSYCHRDVTINSDISQDWRFGKSLYVENTSYVHRETRLKGR